MSFLGRRIDAIIVIRMSRNLQCIHLTFLLQIHLRFRITLQCFQSRHCQRSQHIKVFITRTSFRLLRITFRPSRDNGRIFRMCQRRNGRRTMIRFIFFRNRIQFGREVNVQRTCIGRLLGQLANDHVLIDSMRNTVILSAIILIQTRLANDTSHGTLTIVVVSHCRILDFHHHFATRRDDFLLRAIFALGTFHTLLGTIGSRTLDGRHTLRSIPAIDALASQTALDPILKTFAVLFEAFGFAAFASDSMDFFRGGRLVGV
mmetsp:Transcript_33991/g.65333  ORF Transcript_33991/g.65333 Transcript_33991/m.65333 type:complete len:260 (-) Transcript_33991:750-1529(-)